MGRAGTQRLGLPLAFVRADEADPSVGAHARALVRAAVAAMVDTDALVLDAGFEIRQLQAAGATRYVVRTAKNVTGRRADLPAYPGRGRPRTRGELIRPLARTYQGREVPGTLPDHGVTWQEGETVVRAEWWEDLVLPDVPLPSPTFRLVVIHDPRWTEPLVLATTLPVSARCATWTSTAGRSSSSRSPPSRCSAPPEPSSPLPRPASASQNSRSWPARSAPTLPPPSPPSPPAPGIGDHDPPRAASDGCSLTPIVRLPSHSHTVFAKKPPSPLTCPRAPGDNSTLVRPSPTLRALLSQPQHTPMSPELPETKV